MSSIVYRSTLARTTDFLPGMAVAASLLTDLQGWHVRVRAISPLWGTDQGVWCRRFDSRATANDYYERVQTSPDVTLMELMNA